MSLPQQGKERNLLGRAGGGAIIRRQDNLAGQPASLAADRPSSRGARPSH